MRKSSFLSIIFVIASLFTFANLNSVSAQDFTILLNPTECLDLENSSGANSVRLTVAKCDDSSHSQRFQIVRKAGTAFVNIQISGTRCLDIAPNQMTDGTDITQFNCDGSKGQDFELRNGAVPTSTGSPLTGQIKLTHSGKCFDARTKPWIQQFPCDATATSRQTFQIKNAPSISPNSQFLTKWSADLKKRFPIKLGQIEIDDAISYCSAPGCDCLEPKESDAGLIVVGWTPNLTGPNRDAQALAIKPTLALEYCSSGAAQKGIELDVSISDMNKNNSFATTYDYKIKPSDCTVAKATPTPTPPIVGSTSTPTPPIVTATPNPTPTIPAGPSTVEEQLWNAIKNSKDPNDFQSYIDSYPTGKYAPLARFYHGKYKNNVVTKPSPTSTPTIPIVLSPEDMYWNNIASSTKASDFEGYLKNYPNGKYAIVARQNIAKYPSQETLDDQHWGRVKTSSNLSDVDGYLSAFPSGKHVAEAKKKKAQLEQEKETADFLKDAEFGSLSEISGVRKVFISTTDTYSRNRIISDLRKKAPSIIIVTNRSSADFFIEYKLTVTMWCDPGTSTANNSCEQHTGQIWVHTIRPGTNGNVNRILWTATKTKSYSDAGINFFDKNPAAQAGDDLGKELRNLGF